MFYEIEYDTVPYPRVGKFILKPERIEHKEKCPIRERFSEMRDIYREHRATFPYVDLFDRRLRSSTAAVFYKQAVFMQDFEDDFLGNAPFSQHFPAYQLMSYDQLRTYFTWRAKVRAGNITNIGVSYAFLYIYELLANIGVDDPLDGLNKLISFRETFCRFDSTIDRYVIRWLKDYYIYYNCAFSCGWAEYVERYNLLEHFPSSGGGKFDLYCTISKYNIKSSVFYTEKTKELIARCFLFVIARVRQCFEAAELPFDKALFRQTNRQINWLAFDGALFYNHLQQTDKCIILAENETYTCTSNLWTFSGALTTEKGRRFVGYVMKCMESELRRHYNFRFKLSAKEGMINEDTLRVLMRAGIDIKEVVVFAVRDFYRQETRTIVKVDLSSLDRIRSEAHSTQESLLVESESPNSDSALRLFSDDAHSSFSESTEPETASDRDLWDSLKDSLSDIEVRSLSILLSGEDLKPFSSECGIMLEVLIDGINEKAMDYIGDNLVDDALTLYTEYLENVKGLVK